jgi:hypothetical protein
MADRGLFTNLTCRIDRFVNGSPAGYMDAINLTELTITQPAPDTKTRTSYMAEGYGTALGAVSIPKPTEIQFKTNSMPPAVLSMALLGEPATFAQTATASGGSSGSITVTSADFGTWIPVSHRDASAFELTGVHSGKVAGTDYDISLTAGLIKIIPASEGGTITSGTIAYTITAPARSGTKIIAGTKNLIQISLRGDGTNADTGKRCGLHVYKANISPTGGMPFVGTDYISASFKGTLIKPEDRTGPWEYWEFE